MGRTVVSPTRCYCGGPRWRKEHLMGIKVLGIDLGKTFCSLAGLDAVGAVVFRKRSQASLLFCIARRIASVVVTLPWRTWPIVLPSIPRKIMHHQNLGSNI